MATMTQSERRAARQKAQQEQAKGFDASKIKDVESREQAAAAAAKAAPKPTRTTSARGNSAKEFTPSERDEAMIARVEQLRPYTQLKAVGIENPDRVIERFRESGSAFLRSGLSALAYGGFGVLPSERNVDILVGIQFTRYNDKNGNVAKAEVAESRMLQYDTNGGGYKVFGGAKFKEHIAKACHDLRMTDEQIQEFLSKGYVCGTVGKCIISNNGKKKLDAGEITLDQANLPEYTLGTIVSCWPDGYPLKGYVDGTKNDLVRLMKAKDAEGNNMGFVYKDGKEVFTLTEKDINNLAFGQDVQVTSQNGKTEIIRYNIFEGKVTPTSYIGKSLRAALGEQKIEGKSEAESETREQAAVLDKQAEAGAGIEIGQ